MNRSTDPREWWEGSGYEDLQNAAGRYAGIVGTGGLNATWEEWENLTEEQRQKIAEFIDAKGK